MLSSGWQKANRILAIDGLRGLIMIVMALDHANHFVAQKHSSGEYWGGRFPAYHDALPFLTRLVTHLAAPGFFFLMGVGMLLFARSRQRQGWSRRRIIGHFWIRGTVLIALQLLVINRAWELSPGGWGLQIYIGVLFALGGTMILAGFLLWARPWSLALLAVLLFIGIEMLVPDPALWGRMALRPVELLLLTPSGDQALWSNYPVLPWLELVIFGLLFGSWLEKDRDKAFRTALLLGGIFLAAFVLIRLMDGFGNIRPRGGNNWIDFLNAVKYPPSMAFTLMTTGVNLLLLGLFGRIGRLGTRLLVPLAILGREPLFFYVAHLFLYAFLGWLLTPAGTTIPRMLPIWLLGLAMLYPLCLGYGRFKARQPAGSLFRFI